MHIVLTRPLLLVISLAATSIALAQTAPPTAARAPAPAGDPDADFKIFNQSLRHQAMVDLCLTGAPERGRQLDSAYRQWLVSRTGPIQRTTDSMAAYNAQAQTKLSVAEMRSTAAKEMQELVTKAGGDHRAACADALRWFGRQPVAADVVLRGKTAADPRLVQDIYNAAVTTIRATDGCARVDSIDIKALDFASGTTAPNQQGRLTSGKLSEEWILHGCGKSFPATVTLKPDANGEVDYAITFKAGPG